MLKSSIRGIYEARRGSRAILDNASNATWIYLDEVFRRLQTSSVTTRGFSKSTACLTILVCNTFYWLVFSVKPAVVLSFKDYLQRSHRSMHEGGGLSVPEAGVKLLSLKSMRRAVPV